MGKCPLVHKKAVVESRHKSSPLAFQGRQNFLWNGFFFQHCNINSQVVNEVLSSSFAYMNNRMLQYLSFIYLTAMLCFMLDLCYVHDRSDGVRWRAAFEKCWEQTNFFGTVGNNNPKTSLILWVEVKLHHSLPDTPRWLVGVAAARADQDWWKPKCTLLSWTERSQLSLCELCVSHSGLLHCRTLYVYFPMFSYCVSMVFEIQDYFYINAWES